MGGYWVAGWSELEIINLADFLFIKPFGEAFFGFLLDAAKLAIGVSVMTVQNKVRDRGAG